MNSERVGVADPPVDWTPRQRQVLDLLARGMTNGQLAEALGITLDGAKWHVGEIINKLGVDTREEAAEYWRKRTGLTGRVRAFPRRRALAIGFVSLGAVASVAAIAVVLLALAGSQGKSQASGSALWEPLPAPPLSPRSRVIGAWTGEELLLVGGDTYTCPPGADCIGPSGPAFRDGAALDPKTKTWRTIAPAPIGLEWAYTAVVADDVYFLAVTREAQPVPVVFLRYSVTQDAWEELTPPDDSDAWQFGIVSHDGDLYAFVHSHEFEFRPDLKYDPSTDSWTPIPHSPLGAGFSRTMLPGGDRLYLADQELVPNPGSERPSLARVAAYDPVTGEWDRLPDTGMLGPPGWSEGDVLVSPNLGGADGGQVNNWGREYPYGGIVDGASGAWTPLPDPGQSGVFSAGVIGTESAWYFGAGQDALVLDMASQTWIPFPALDPQDPYTERRTWTAGRDAVIFGGVRWTGSSPEILGDAWIWRAP